MESNKITREGMYSLLLKMIAENLEDHDISKIDIKRHLSDGWFPLGNEWTEPYYIGSTVTIKFESRKGT